MNNIQPASVDDTMCNRLVFVIDEEELLDVPVNDQMALPTIEEAKLPNIPADDMGIHKQ